jgi:hypothetical protein
MLARHGPKQTLGVAVAFVSVSAGRVALQRPRVFGSPPGARRRRDEP